jgi:UDPglucose 6-dehydrogenase
VCEIIKRTLNAKTASIGVLGITFKNNTNDTRESQSIKLINKLKNEGFNVNAYDPIIKEGIDNVKICKNMKECIESSDILVIATEWDEFKNIETSKPIIDAKRLLDLGKNNVIPIGFGQSKTKMKT